MGAIDGLFVVGAGAIVTGVAFMHPPSAMIVGGFFAAALAVINALRRRRSIR